MNTTKSYNFGKQYLETIDPNILAKAVFLVGVFLTASVAFVGTLYMSISTASYMALILAVILRKNRKVHMTLANSAIFTDLTLVLILEFNRDAIAQVTDLSLNAWQLGHVIASSLAVLLYVPVFCIGLSRALGKAKSPVYIQNHKRLGLTALGFRSVGWVLMFSLL